MISVEGSPFKNDLLKDKTIWVTGGGTGLGKSMATLFSGLGAKVAISSRKEDVLKKAADEISEQTGNAVFIAPMDVREPKLVEDAYEKIKSDFGQPNSLLNNAAGNFISPTERLSSRAFKVIIDIVLYGSVNTTLVCGKDWLKQGIKGNLLNIVTTYAWTGSGYVVPSATAKAGVLAMTRSLAVEWGKKGIRSNAIAPGPFPTKGAWSRLMPGEMAENFDFGKRVPLNRVGEHQELANLATFLMSDHSAYINGEVVTIDGGEWLKGAGQFNMLEAIPESMWDMIETQVRKTKGS
jgi:NAD(P)-dependent dehydrogenase (short-subunit alcohol dehydrogenase family)